ncbi:mitochondrial ribosome-associated GTPase 1 isoform X2 [Zonotrichia albicollis]|uniref:mitochondrial ribosome-associated GTPase 1 isoform X2 n=1 Tax=Zonotrichia albicollis TaxID=44394 RepID=UPI003D80B868
MRVWAALRAAGTAPGAFRERFEFGGRDVASWFPRHMAKGLRQMRLALRRADCLVEVHDARIPLSGRNPALQEALGIRPHVLVLNKVDLADPRRQPEVLERLRQQGCSHVVFTDCQRDVNVKKVVPMVARLVADGPRYHRAESSEHNILVIGVPNVGKSSLINSLRRLHLKKGKATAVGGEPGITKAVLSRIQVCEKPLMYLVDTPGVLPPRLGDVETGMKLALCGAILDHLVGEDIMADYLLYTLNKQQQFRECQHDDAQLRSCCLRVPAGLPSRTPGQGDTGLRPIMDRHCRQPWGLGTPWCALELGTPQQGAMGCD